MTTSTENFGVIYACAGYVPICHWKCCAFADNYIVLYPGEFENTRLNTSHLRIIEDDYFGGKRAVCTRSCTRADLKPLDCRSYPLFPRVDGQGRIELLRGSKCPLTSQDLAVHQDHVLEAWQHLMTENPDVRRWLHKVVLVGYVLYAVAGEGLEPTAPAGADGTAEPAAEDAEVRPGITA